MKGWCFHSGSVVIYESQEATIGVMNGSEETPLSVVRPCGMAIPPSETFDIS